MGMNIAEWYPKMDGATTKEEWLTFLAVLCNAISLLGTCTLLVIYSAKKKIYQKPALRLIAAIAISDGITELGYILGYPTDEGVCSLQGVVISFGYLTSAIWVINVAFLLEVINREELTSVPQLIQRFHYITWPVSAVLCLLPFITDSYGPISGYCWIYSDAPEHLVWRGVTYYGPRFIVFGYSIYVYYRFYRNHRLNPEQNSAQRASKRLFWYPAALFFCGIWATISHAINMAYHWNEVDTTVTVYTIISQSLDGLYGLVNVVLFFQAKPVKSALREMFGGEAGNDSPYEAFNQSPSFSTGDSIPPSHNAGYLSTKRTGSANSPD